MAKQTFKIGDIVVSKTGKKPFKITTIHNNYGSRYCCGTYLHNNKTTTAYYFCNLKLYSEEEQLMTNKILYSFKLEDGTVAYGTHVGTNSENKYLIEVKGTGNIVLKSKSELEEVLPYTYSISDSGNEINVIGEPDTVNVGDILMYFENKTYKIVQVTGVNTKSKSARSKIKNAVRLVTEKL